MCVLWCAGRDQGCVPGSCDWCGGQQGTNSLPQLQQSRSVPHTNYDCSSPPNIGACLAYQQTLHVRKQLYCLITHMAAQTDYRSTNPGVASLQAAARCPLPALPCPARPAVWHSMRSHSQPQATCCVLTSQLQLSQQRHATTQVGLDCLALDGAECLCVCCLR